MRATTARHPISTPRGPLTGLANKHPPRNQRGRTPPPSSRRRHDPHLVVVPPNPPMANGGPGRRPHRVGRPQRRAKAGEDVVRVVAGDRLTTDSVPAVRSTLPPVPRFALEVLPDCLPPPSLQLRGHAAWSTGHSRRRGMVSSRLVGAGSRPGSGAASRRRGHLAEAASALHRTRHGCPDPVAITINGTTSPEGTIEGTLATINELGGARWPGRLVLTVGKAVSRCSSCR